MSLTAVAAFALSLSGAQAADPPPPSVAPIVGAFEAAYRDCGLEPLFSPQVRLGEWPVVMNYNFVQRTVYVGRYADLPDEMKGLMGSWAAAAGAQDGEALFGDVFNGLLVPHEMGHWTQHLSRRAITLDHWEGEVEANRIAIAYWSLDPVEAARLPARIEAFTGFLGQIPSPVPEGETPRDFFNANYEALGADAAAYGWFQGAFMREAWARRGEMDFCDLARLNSPAPAADFANDPTPDSD